MMLISPNLALLYLINGQISEREGKLRENSDPRHHDCVSIFFFRLLSYSPNAEPGPRNSNRLRKEHRHPKLTKPAHVKN